MVKKLFMFVFLLFAIVSLGYSLSCIYNPTIKNFEVTSNAGEFSVYEVTPRYENGKTTYEANDIGFPRKFKVYEDESTHFLLSKNNYSNSTISISQPQFNDTEWLSHHLRDFENLNGFRFDHLVYSDNLEEFQIFIGDEEVFSANFEAEFSCGGNYALVSLFLLLVLLVPVAGIVVLIVVIWLIVKHFKKKKQ